MHTPNDPEIETLLQERRATMLSFYAGYRPLNMYAICRLDLDMAPGKLAAQCGHAFLGSYENARLERPEITANYRGTGEGTKIVMGANSLQRLVRAYRKTRESHLPHHLVIDRGHVLPPHFSGEPIVTALGIGPAFRDEVEQIIKRYSMIR